MSYTHTSQNTQNPFVICKAAAGSGKTFTLVKEYLKLAMTVPDGRVRRDRAAFAARLRSQFAGILAVTFTNKAAGEMKARVMDYLEQMALYGADPAQSRMGAPLLAALNEQPCYRDNPVSDSELRWMAETVRSAMLHRYSDLSVCTIDSFMHRIVRTFAHDLGRPVNFEVMIDQDEMIEQAVEQLMMLVGTPGHEPLTRVVQAYADSRMEEEEGYNIEGALRKLARQLFREDTAPYVEALKPMEPEDFIACQRSLTAECRRFEAEAKRCGAAVLEAVARAGAGEADCAGGRNGYYSFFRGLAAGNVRPLTNTVVKAFEGAKLHSAKCPPPVQSALLAEYEGMYDLYDHARTLLGVADLPDEHEGAPLREYNTRQILLRNIYTMALLDQLADQLRLYDRTNEVVHLSEFNWMINEIVCSEPAPFIYERLGNRYHHYLIDEFQDTSVLQWHNLVPLVENGVSQRYESLVVGDGKQAIYRFRQGDVRQFVRLPHVDGMALHGRTLAAQGNYTEQHLDTNYRTTRAVVEFNNCFFTWLLKREPLASNTLAQQIYVGTPDSEGRPELWQHLPEHGVAEGHVGIAFTADGDSATVCEEVRKIIVRLVTQQGYRQQDIMVLGRSNRDLDRVSTYLQTHTEELRIGVSSSESFFLVRSHAVMTVVAALRLLHDGSDRTAAADLMQRLYNLQLIDSAHHEDFLSDGEPDVAAMLRSEGCGFDFRPDYLASLDLYDCCEELLRELHLDGLDTAYVGSLLGRVAAFAARNHSGVGAFLEWFDTNADADPDAGRHRQLSAASPEGVDAVRLLTIHKAKGLEAPVVICPFFKGERSHGYSLWVNLDERFRTGAGQALPAAYVTLGSRDTSLFDAVRDEERRLEEVDRLNVLYVALTRPQEQLFVVCPTPSENSTDVMAYPRLLKAFVDEEKPYLGDAGFRHREGGGEDVKQGQVELRQLSFAEWTTKVKVASRAEKALSALQEERLRFGSLAHDLLAQVLHADDVEAAVARLARNETVDDVLRTRLSNLAKRVVTHPDTERFFRPEYPAKTECDLCDAEGICRPDRVVLADGETWVVDFKTGQEHLDEHDRQVRRYCRAMSEMGYPRVSGWLLYLQPEVHVRRVMTSE